MLLQQAVPAAVHPLSGTAADYLWLLPLLPLLGFVINGLVALVHAYRTGPNDPSLPPPSEVAHGQGRGKEAVQSEEPVDVHEPSRHPLAWISTVIGPVVLAASFALAAAIFLEMRQAGDLAAPFVQTYFSWMPVGELRIDWAFQLDQLSMVMVLVVTGVGTLIHIFSIGYMRDDPGYPRFFSFLNLFVAFMLVLVLGANYPVMFVGWEGVGLCSYLLIGYWYGDKANADAGKKAFIMNRIGDAGFLVAMFLLFVHLGSLDFVTLSGLVPGLQYGGAVLTAICLFFFLACTGKSAQIPLFTWLPDAMAGPTPVSALIHAATMVTAGVYLIARSGFLFAMAPVASITVAVVGALTAIFAATIGLKQWDIKRVLAYSTVSQLGYMFVAVGVGAYVAGIFHLTTHAFFKALLFLGAGSVIYVMHAAYHATHSHDDAQDMRNMGGLRRHMKATWLLMWVATLAIAGFPLLSGFFSKDEILASTFARAQGSALADALWLGLPGRWVLFAVYAVALAAAFLTAVYMTRMMVYTFHGPNRTGEQERRHLREAPLVMTAPLILLGILSAAGGWLNYPGIMHELLPFGRVAALEHWLEPVVHRPTELLLAGAPALPDHSTELVLIAVATAAGLAGIITALVLLKPARLVPRRQAPPERGIERILLDKYYVDEAYDRAFVRPTVEISRRLLWRGVDQGLIDGVMVNGPALLARGFAWIGSQLQSGQVGTYAWAIVIGVIAILGAFTLRLTQ